LQIDPEKVLLLYLPEYDGKMKRNSYLCFPMAAAAS